MISNQILPSQDAPDDRVTLPKADPRLTVLTDLAATLGYEIVDVAGFLNEVDAHSHNQIAALGDVSHSVRGMLDANAIVRKTVDDVTSTAEKTLETVEGSVAFVRASGQRSNTVASWVTALTDRMAQVSDALAKVEENNTEIAGIARQVNILAINAKIEAARAGETGRGFGVVAEAINELSQKTAKAAQQIEGNITTLSGWVSTLLQESTGVGEDATKVIEGASDTDVALTSIAQGVRSTHDQAVLIKKAAETAQGAMQQFEPSFEKITTSVRQTASGIHESRERVNALVDNSEIIVQQTVALGGVSTEMQFINRVMTDAAEISRQFDAAVTAGTISIDDLLDRTYQPISGTNPQQVMTRFTKFTDALLPPIQEAALEFSQDVVFCAAVDFNGYLPTHNAKFSQPQGRDVEWNTANCRNRRIFDDRVGLKAGRNTEPFLLQVYRRDMGGGVFKMMTDVSAPIYVKGRHWGGLRLAYAR